MKTAIKISLVLFIFMLSLGWYLTKKKERKKYRDKRKENELNGALDGFFITESIKNLDQLKKQYRKLSMIYHPDKGGSVKQMQDLNDEYDKLRKKLKSGANLTDEESNLEDELDEVYKDVIATLITIPSIDIEIIGNWIWVSGNTYPVKDVLKNLNFKFSRNKKMWYWHTKDYKKKSKKKFDIDEIREMYKTTKVESKYKNNILNGLHNDLSYLQGLLNYR